MKLLIADDDPVARSCLTALCRRWGYEVVAAPDGEAAWAALQGTDAPALALVDCQMPGRTGDELCRMARAQLGNRPLHIILITATRLALEEKVAGLGAGADDYLTKDYEPAELQARLKVGERVVNLQSELHRRVQQLESALAQVTQLQGLLPICMDCKKIRDDKNYWHQVEKYIAQRSSVAFTHSLCPTCFEKRVSELAVGAWGPALR